MVVVVEQLEEADGARSRFVWIDMFCASQNLLAGKYRDLKYDQGNDVTEKVSG